MNLSFNQQYRFQILWCVVLVAAVDGLFSFFCYPTASRQQFPSHAREYPAVSFVFGKRVLGFRLNKTTDNSGSAFHNPLYIEFHPGLCHLRRIAEFHFGSVISKFVADLVCFCVNFLVMHNYQVFRAELIRFFNTGFKFSNFKIHVFRHLDKLIASEKIVFHSRMSVKGSLAINRSSTMPGWHITIEALRVSIRKLLNSRS